MTDRYDVLVAGEYYCDLIFTGLSTSPAYGEEIIASGLTTRPGGCYNMALGLTRLGLRTAWVSDFGTDLFSRLVLDSARADGIDPVAAGLAEHGFGGRTDRLDGDFLAGELGLGQFDQLGRSVADDRAVRRELRGKIIDIGLAYRRLGAEDADHSAP